MEPESRPFRFFAPDGVPVPLLLNSPHSGDEFPDSFVARAQLPVATLRRASDLYVDRLFRPCLADGASMLAARYPRSYLDLNREPLELDPRLIEGPLPPEANTRSLRVAGGLGVVPRVIGDRMEIHAGKLSFDEAVTRIDRAYLPYHAELRRRLAALHAAFGSVVLLDCHSMPSQPAGLRGAKTLPDLVLGDRFGSSCDPWLIEAAETAARAEGFRVERNQPYAGGYITEHYGRPRAGWQALQIEVNRALYMDEARLEPHDGFVAMSEALRRIVGAMRRADPCQNGISDLHFFQRAAE